MIGIVLLLAALGITGLLAAVLVVVVRSRLRERAELAEANRPSVPASRAVEALAAPRKPALVPWLVISAVAVGLLTLAGGGLLRGCQAIGQAQTRERDRWECQRSMQGLSRWFYTDWEQRKVLPPSGAVPVDAYVNCPRGNAFKYVGGADIRLGGRRVLVVELGAHEVAGGDGERQAIVGDPKFLASGQTCAEYQAAFNGGNAGYVSADSFFEVRSLSEDEYASIRLAVESAP